MPSELVLAGGYLLQCLFLLQKTSFKKKMSQPAIPQLAGIKKKRGRPSFLSQVRGLKEKICRPALVTNSGSFKVKKGQPNPLPLFDGLKRKRGRPKKSERDIINSEMSYCAARDCPGPSCSDVNIMTDLSYCDNGASIAPLYSHANVMADLSYGNVGTNAGPHSRKTVNISRNVECCKEFIACHITVMQQCHL